MTQGSGMLGWLRNLLYSRFSQILIDAGVLAASLAVAYLIRFDGRPPDPYAAQALSVAPYVVGLSLLICAAFGVYRFVWRYVGVSEAITIATALLVATAILVGLRLFLPGSLQLLRVPRGVIAIYFQLSAIGMVGVRLVRRLTHERWQLRSRWSRPGGTRVLLVGAGGAGIAVAKEMLQRPDLGLVPVGFVDDDARKARASIQTVPVLGATGELAALVRAHRIDEVIITISSAPPRVIRRIVHLCEQIPVRVRIVPGLHEILGERVSFSKLREVNIEDLLARDVASFDPTEPELVEAYTGRRVLVTGAAGSIGSELCRQLMRLKPDTVIVLDKDENGVFELDASLRDLFGSACRIQPVILDIGHTQPLRRLIAETRPHAILHAAAFKHVPLLESNVVEAVRNNVLATFGLVELAVEFGVGIFVMISTDKAVNPTSVMGATKRVAERIVQAAAQSDGARFCCVRFGNVLGSRGSVVPIFTRQIAQGGPVTVTHPDMTRYFMTIGEASQLVIKAGSVGQRGEIFVLDMGEPVRVVDLAKDLIRLSRADGMEDIEIVFTGPRPGEKLHEQLIPADEGTRPTKFQKILVTHSAALSHDEIRRMVAEFERHVVETDAEGLLRSLAAFAPGYHRPARAGQGVSP